MTNELFFSMVILISVFISSISQILLKKSANKQYDTKLQEYINPFVITGYALFFGCTLINIIALKYVPLSLVPILESSGYLHVIILGALFLNEKITKKQILGIAFILFGILIFTH